MDRKIKTIKDYLMTLEDTPFISETFPNSLIERAYNAAFVENELVPYIYPPFSVRTGESLPERAVAFFILKNGLVFCRTEYGNEFRLDRLVGDSLDNILEAIEEHKTRY